jgi:hypothetical protein
MVYLEGQFPEDDGLQQRSDLLEALLASADSGEDEEVNPAVLPVTMSPLLSPQLLQGSGNAGLGLLGGLLKNIDFTGTESGYSGSGGTATLPYQGESGFSEFPTYATPGDTTDPYADVFSQEVSPDASTFASPSSGGEGGFNAGGLTGLYSAINKAFLAPSARSSREGLGLTKPEEDPSDSESFFHGLSSNPWEEAATATSPTEGYSFSRNVERDGVGEALSEDVGRSLQAGIIQVSPVGRTGLGDAYSGRLASGPTGRAAQSAYGTGVLDNAEDLLGTMGLSGFGGGGFGY